MKVEFARNAAADKNDGFWKTQTMETDGAGDGGKYVAMLPKSGVDGCGILTLC